MSERYVANNVALILLALIAWRHFGGSLPDIIPIDPPAPTVDPIDGDGFRVLIVYESSELQAYPSSQTAALYSTQVRSYLNSKCVAGERSSPDYRILDADTDMTNDSAWWQKAMTRDRQSLPWIVIDAKDGGFEGPLPLTVAETMTLLQTYGG